MQNLYCLCFYTVNFDIKKRYNLSEYNIAYYACCFLIEYSFYVTTEQKLRNADDTCWPTNYRRQRVILIMITFENAELRPNVSSKLGHGTGCDGTQSTPFVSRAKMWSRLSMSPICESRLPR